MDRVNFIEYKGKQILSLDFSELSDPDEIIQVLEYAKKVIESQKEGTVLTLTNVKNTRFDIRVSEGFKEFVLHNKPYAKGGAIIGLSGFQKIVYNTATRISKRNIPAFEDIEQAKEYLSGL